MFIPALLPFFLLFSPLMGDEIDEILHDLDHLFRSENSQVEMAMTISTPHWERTLNISAWTKGMDETFLVINTPKKDKGIATLRKDKEMWNYFPKVDKIIKIPPSMMMGSWMGSDFTNDDLVRESSFTDDFDASLIHEESLPDDLLLISLKPKEQTITVWGEIRLYVQKSDHIPTKQIYYDEHGEKIRVRHLKDIQEFDGKKIPSILEMIPLSKEGNKTTVYYLNAQFDRAVEEDTFTLRNLKKKR